MNTALLRAIRPHQWIKNALVFAPVLLSHRFADNYTWLNAARAFAAFSAAASAVYVINGLIDAKWDREHPTKRKRPFASGTISRATGTWMISVLMALSAVAAYSLPRGFIWMLAGYLAVGIWYSLQGRSLALVDVVALAGLYTLRVLAGGAATGIVISPWTLGASLFLFLSLALAKRYSELLTHGPSSGRGYEATDVPLLSSMGLASGYLTALVIAIYLQTPEVHRLYRRPEWIWLICPVYLLWISRIWLLAGRGEVKDDPLLFSLRDRATYFLAAVASAFFVRAL